MLNARAQPAHDQFFLEKKVLMDIVQPLGY